MNIFIYLGRLYGGGRGEMHLIFLFTVKRRKWISDTIPEETLKLAATCLEFEIIYLGLPSSSRKILSGQNKGNIIIPGCVRCTTVFVFHFQFVSGTLPLWILGFWVYSGCGDLNFVSPETHICYFFHVKPVCLKCRDNNSVFPSRDLFWRQCYFWSTSDLRILLMWHLFGKLLSRTVFFNIIHPNSSTSGWASAV